MAATATLSGAGHMSGMPNTDHNTNDTSTNMAPVRKRGLGGWLSMAPSTSSDNLLLPPPVPAAAATSGPEASQHRGKNKRRKSGSASGNGKPSRSFECEKEDCNCAESSGSGTNSSQISSGSSTPLSSSSYRSSENMVGTTTLVPPSIISRDSGVGESIGSGDMATIMRERSASSSSDVSLNSSDAASSDADSITGAAFDFRRSMLPMAFGSAKLGGKDAERRSKGKTRRCEKGHSDRLSVIAAPGSVVSERDLPDGSRSQYGSERSEQHAASVDGRSADLEEEEEGGSCHKRSSKRKRERGHRLRNYVSSTPGGTQHVVNGGGGMKHSGIEWSGKTLHAVEQEMEKLGRREWMSNAPDPAYLATRLEAVRRNLEIEDREEEEERDEGEGLEGEKSGRQGRKKRWLSWSDEEEAAIQVDGQEEHASAPYTDMKTEKPISRDSPITIQVPDGNPADVGPIVRISSPPSAASSPMASTPSDFYGASPPLALRPPSMLNREAARAPPPTTVEAPIDHSLAAAAQARAARAEKLNAEAGIEMLSLKLEPVDHQSQLQALEQRVEIRDSKRSDLEQVRDLHCLHGDERLLGLDADDDIRAFNFDTYTTSATFLLRLLVDENHISVVAVAKPLPEPEPLPTSASLSTLASMPSSRDTSRERENTQVTLQGSPLHQEVMLDSLDDSASSSSDRAAVHVVEHEDGRHKNQDSNPTSDSDDASRAPTSLFSSSPGHGVTLGDKLSGLTPATSIVTNSQGSPMQMPTRYPTMNMKIDTPPIPQLVLEGPEFIAPPPAKRIMGVAPPKGKVQDSEVILGVASAAIAYRHPTPEDLFSNSTSNICGPEELDRSECSTIHVLTLSILPAERSQGLGGKLLDELLTRAKARLQMQHMLAKRRKAASAARRGSSSASVKETEEDAPKVRAYLEVHPSNTRAIELYERKGFTKPSGSSGIKKGFYRGDERIPSRIRLHPGGRDAWVFERWLS